MAISTVKSTYSLDLETVRLLDSLAHRWRVSKSEALRRSIRVAAEVRSSEQLRQLDALQRGMALSAQSAAKWARTARAQRRASAARREARWR